MTNRQTATAPEEAGAVKAEMSFSDRHSYDSTIPGNGQEIARDVRRAQFCTVDNVIIDEFGARLGPHGLAVYVVLCRYASADSQRCWPSLNTIAERTGMSVRKVRYTLRQLEDLRLIHTEQRKETSSVYTLLDPPNETPPPAPRAAPPAPRAAPPAPRAAPPRHHVPQNNTYMNKTQQQHTPRAETETRDGVCDNETSARVAVASLNNEQQAAFDALVEIGFTPERDARRYAMRDPARAAAWAEYARAEGLGGGFVRKRLDAGDDAPEARRASPPIPENTEVFE